MAVYTEVAHDDLVGFLRAYDLGDVITFKGIAEGVENTNYLLQTETGTYILTLYEKRVKEADLPFFLGLMNHLAKKGIACPTAVKTRAGATYGHLRGRPAAIITFLNGVSVRRVTPSQCAEVGTVLAQMHLAGQDFPRHRENALSVDHWRELLDASRAGTDTVKPGMQEELSAELDFLEAHWPRDLPAGIIHADLFPSNVFFLGGKLSGVIDFYFACHDLFAYELAICLNAWCFESDGAFNVTRAKRMLAAYHAVRPWTREELDCLPVLARGAAMRFLLTRLYDWLHHIDGVLVRPHDPLEYLQRLHFHQRITGPEGYGADLDFRQ